MEFLIAMLLIGTGIGIALGVFLFLFSHTRGFQKLSPNMVLVIGGGTFMLASFVGGVLLRVVI